MVSCGGKNRESNDVRAVEDTIRNYVITYNNEESNECLNFFTGYEDKDDALAYLSFMRGLSGKLELREIKEITIVPVAVPGGNRSATASITFSASGEENIDWKELKEVESKWKIIWR